MISGAHVMIFTRDEAADVGNALQEHDDERDADGVNRQVLPFGAGA